MKICSTFSNIASPSLFLSFVLMFFKELAPLSGHALVIGMATAADAIRTKLG